MMNISTLVQDQGPSNIYIYIHTRFRFEKQKAT